MSFQQSHPEKGTSHNRMKLFLKEHLRVRCVFSLLDIVLFCTYIFVKKDYIIFVEINKNAPLE